MCRDTSTSHEKHISDNYGEILGVVFEKVDRLSVGRMAEFVRAYYLIA